MRLTLALLGLVLATAVQARMLDVILHGWRLGKAVSYTHLTLPTICSV